MLRRRRRVKAGSQSREDVKSKWLECRNGNCFEICLVSGDIGKVLCGRCVVLQAGDAVVPKSYKVRKAKDAH